VVFGILLVRVAVFCQLVLINIEFAFSVVHVLETVSTFPSLCQTKKGGEKRAGY